MSDVIVFVDPGVRGSGISTWFLTGELCEARYVVGDKLAPGGYECVPVQVSASLYLARPVAYVIELPRIYPPPPGRSFIRRKDPNDLVHVAAVGGGWAAIAAIQHALTVQVMPSEWKGNTKKDVFTRLIKAELDDFEYGRCQFTNKSDDIDMLDAVGMGMWFFGRLGKRSPRVLELHKRLTTGL